MADLCGICGPSELAVMTAWQRQPRVLDRYQRSVLSAATCPRALGSPTYSLAAGRLTVGLIPKSAIAPLLTDGTRYANQQQLILREIVWMSTE